MDLNEFVEGLRGEAYDDESRGIIDTIIGFLYDVWERDEKLTIMIHKYISANLYPVVFVDIEETADLAQLEIRGISTNNNYEPKKADIVAFNRFCKQYFKTLKPLYDRFCLLES